MIVASESSAAALIRALSIHEEGEDQAAWTARWTNLLQTSSTEDVEAAVADLVVQCARLNDRVNLMRRGHVAAVRQGTLIHFLRIRKAQLKFLQEWVRTQDQLEADAAKRETQERLSAEATARAQMRLKAHEATQQRLAQADLARRESVEGYRAYKLAIVEREREIARERVAFIREQIPDGSDPVLMVLAARHIMKRLHQKLTEAGVAPGDHLSEHEKLLDYAIHDWLRVDPMERAVLEVDEGLAPGGQS